MFFPSRPHSIGTLTSIAQDRSGFLWFGSHYDVHRFDGYKRVIYSPDPRNPASLSGGQIKDIVVSSSNQVWIATGANGLSVYSSENESFSNFEFSESDPKSIPSNAVLALASDNMGGVWVGTSLGLARVDEHNHQVQRYLHLDKSKAVYNSEIANKQNTIRSLFIDASDMLWVGHEMGISQMDINSRHYSPLNLFDENGALWQGVVTSIYQTSDGQVWVGTEKQGVGRILDNRIIFYPVNEPETLSLHNPNIKDFIQVKDKLWVGTYGGGITIIDIASKNIVRTIKASAEDVDSGIAIVWKFFRDESGLIWVSTTNGLFKFDPNADAFVFLQHRENDPRSLSYNNILSVYEHSDGHIWVSYLSNGIDVLDSNFNKIKHYKPDKTKENWFSTHITDIEEDDKGNIWLASYGEGVLTFDPNNNQLTAYKENLLHTKVSVILHFDQKIWIGTHEGLNFLDLKTKKISAVTQVKGASTPAVGRIFDLSVYTDNSLWIASSTGLYVLPAASEELMYFPSEPEKEGGLLGKAFMEIEIDAKDRLLLRTVGYGIEVVTEWDGKTAKFQSLFDRLKLKDKTTGHLTSDKLGRLWTIAGVFSEQHDSYMPLKPIDGLYLEAHAWTNSHGKTRSGIALYSTKAGLNIFDPSLIKGWGYEPPVVATEILLGGKKQELGTNEVLELPPDNKGFTVEFSALDFSDPDSNQYAYRLEGYDLEWTETGVDRRLASFMNLDPGDYTLRVKGTNRHGEWSTRELLIPIKQIAAWYQTWWFKLLVSLSTVLLIYAIHTYRMRLLKARTILLRSMVKERTEELASSNEALASSNDKLESANQELKLLAKELELLATTDSLTGLANVRKCREFLEQVWQVGVREKSKIAVILLDVDYFKRFNDTYGHQEGDNCLQAVAQVLQKNVHRPLDLAARYGGEEFLIILANTDLDGAMMVAERIRKNVEALAILHESSEAAKCVTVSLGVASTIPTRESTFDALVKKADDELYVSKERGRNRASGVAI